MSTEASLRLKLKKKAKVVLSVSRNSVRTRGDENSFDKDRVYDRENGLKQRGRFKGMESGEEGRAFRTRKNENSFDNDRVYDRENGLKQRGRFKGMESGEEGRAFRTRKNENSFDKDRVYDRENGLKQRGKFKGMESSEEGRALRTRKNENSFDNDRVYDRENGLKQRGRFKGMESGEEGRAFRTRKNENSFDKDRVYDRENGLKQRGKFKGMESSEEGRALRTRKFENSFDKDRVYDRENGLKQRGKFKGRESGEEGRALRARKFENSFDKDRVYDRENGLKQRGKFKGMESNEEGMGREFGKNRGKLRTLDSSGRKKRIYAKEERFENGKLWNGVGGSKKKTLFNKVENQVKYELDEVKTDDHRTMWGPGISWNAGKKTKHLTDKVKDKKENSSFVEKKDQDKPGLKKNDRDKAWLDGNAEVLDDRPKKKKKVIRIEYPNDISKKRVDDGLDFNGIKEEKKMEPEKEPVMSKNAEFRAIQPSPSILSFVENNLLGKRRLIDLRRAGYNIELSAPLDNIPFSKSSERERIEENAFRNKLEFFAAAKVSSSFPPPNLPEIAFAGRSNVGKSSLLNALTRQWGVARTSDRPGLTQTINFFSLGTKLCLVDLPGYGFAYAKDEVKENWEELVKEYVSTRIGLRRVCLLVDTKWGMKPRDHELIELMERSKTKYQILLTKTDVVFPIDVARRSMQIEESLLGNQSIVQPLMMVSSKSGAGIRSLRTVLANIARFAKI